MKPYIFIVISILFFQIQTYGQLLESKEILVKNQSSYDAQFFNHETQLAVRLKNSIEVYQLNPASKVYSLNISATALATARQSNTLAVASSQGKVSFYSGDSLTREFKTGEGKLGQLEFYEAQGKFACWTSNSEVSIWSIDKASKLQTYPTGNLIITDIAFSMDGTHLLLATNEGKVIVWCPDSGEIIEKKDVHKGFVRGLAIHPDGDRYASCGDDGTIAIHSLSDNNYYKLEKSHSNFLMDIEFLDENMLLGVGHDHRISLNNINPLPGSFSIRNYFYTAKQDKFSGDKYPGSISVSNKNRLIGIATLGKGVILSSHFHDFLICSYKLELGVNYTYSEAKHGVDNHYSSAIKRCNVGGVVNRHESIKNMCLVDHFHDTRHQLKIESNGGFSIDVDLNQKNNRFDLIIEDFDEKLKPVKYSMLVERL